MSFPIEIKEKAMIACARRCCLCHKFCGVGMECHHIAEISKGGENTFDNCIPLCFDCHAEVGHYSNEHPKGTKFTPGELKAHRDRWFSQVINGVPENPPNDFIELDKKLFNKLYDMLGGVYQMIHFRDHDYGSSYPRQVEENLFNFTVHAALPQSEFFNFHMETAFADLKTAIRKYKETSMNRVWWESSGTAGIPKEWRYQDEESIARHREAVELMNIAASLVWNAFSAFIKEGRRQLKVEVNT